MDKKGIEFVCKGCRISPIAELIARHYLVKQGLIGSFKARSSGSHVDDIANGRVSYERKVEWKMAPPSSPPKIWRTS